jgi:hypothetical protein
MASDHAGLDIFVVQSDGIHIVDDLVLVAAIEIDGDRVKDPLGLVDHATENTAEVQSIAASRTARMPPGAQEGRSA